MTLEITCLSLILGFIVGIPLSFGQVYGMRGIRIIISLYEKIVRSIPELVILFLVFYGFPRLGIRFQPLTACVVGFGLRSAAYQSQIFNGAIKSVGSNQMRAARSIGMTKRQGFSNVILPQALRLALPGWTNEFTIVLKDSSLAYALGVTELLREGQYVVSTKYEPMIIYITVAVIYFLITFVINRSLGRVEKAIAVPGFELRGQTK